jgi:TRAP-type C4-dicarboxylate transport system permease small subunit
VSHAPDLFEVTGDEAIAERDERAPGLLGALNTALHRVNGLATTVSAIAVGVAGCVLTWEVIGRYFLKIPSEWQDELSVFLLVGATFLAAAWIQARRGHVGIDALAAILPPGADRIRRIFADFASLVFCVFFCWKSWTLLIEAIEEGQITGSPWGPPLWIPYGVMTAGMTLLCLQLALQLAGWFAPQAAEARRPR